MLGVMTNTCPPTRNFCFPDKLNTLIWGNKKRNWETHLYNRDIPKDADTVTLQIKDLNNNILVQQPFTILQ